MTVRQVVDRGVRYLLLISALISVFIVFLIFLFTIREGGPAISGIGLRIALGEIGYPVYGTYNRALIRAKEGELREGLEQALMTSQGKLQDAVEKALASADAADGRHPEDLQAEIKRARSLNEDIERVLDEENALSSEVELREAVEGALQQAVEVALRDRTGLNFPSWASGAMQGAVGLKAFLTGGEWRPDYDKLGIWLMIVGSVFVTFGAIVLGVPLALGAAIFLAEVAPSTVRDVVRPAVELLAGIPSVVYGLFGMVVLVPLVGKIPVSNAQPTNTGYGLLSASIVLAVMILPTITNIAEDAIRAVPREYKDGSLALGATHWQTIVSVILPAARSGIIAAIILGVGRALGETMAMIMVIGNSVRIAQPLNSNPLTTALSQTRTLTGNIAVEIAYATGLQEDAIFATGVVLFVLIMIVNSMARILMRERAK
jgi:phosphate transport system permease protein